MLPPQVGKNSPTSSYTRQKGKEMEVFQAKFPQSRAIGEILPAPTWGRMNDVEKETHISAFLS